MAEGEILGVLHHLTTHHLRLTKTIWHIKTFLTQTNYNAVFIYPQTQYFELWLKILLLTALFFGGGTPTTSTKKRSVGCLAAVVPKTGNKL